MFCSSRANEKLPPGGCPGCGTAWPYGEVRALRALQVISGFVFVILGGFCIDFSAIVLKDLFQGNKIPWGVFAVLFGVGGIFLAGGFSSFFGQSWLFRLLLVFFGVALRRSGPQRKR
jgi:hypothetical protein